MQICPYCESELSDTAKKCKFCGEWIENNNEKEKNSTTTGFSHSVMKNGTRTRQNANMRNSNLRASTQDKKGTNKLWILIILIIILVVVYVQYFYESYTDKQRSKNFSSYTQENLINNNGYQIVTYDNGDRYEGNFSNGLKDGKGIMYYKNGNRYDGYWMNGEKNGYGTFYWNNGDHYEGNWKNGLRNGFGKYYWNNGNRYEGNWENGLKKGQGIIYYSYGLREEGFFVDDVLEGDGKVYTKDGKLRFEGTFKAGYTYDGTVYSENGRKGGTCREGLVYDLNGKYLFTRYDFKNDPDGILKESNESADEVIDNITNIFCTNVADDKNKMLKEYYSCIESNNNINNCFSILKENYDASIKAGEMCKGEEQYGRIVIFDGMYNTFLDCTKESNILDCSSILK